MKDTEVLEDLRIKMLKFASLQLSDAHLAEDAVQDAFLGAMKNAHKFGGRSAYKTWVFAILKNKIADILRQRYRVDKTPSQVLAMEETDELESHFDSKGYWRQDRKPQDWGNPETALTNTEFWKIFQGCLEHLPGQQGQAFMMREFIELDSEEICALLDISVSNLNVMLYRARIRLRNCLEGNWFLEAGP
jgi:RNA polymerase sigma-70 factor (TIGR02943 family)